MKKLKEIKIPKLHDLHGEKYLSFSHNEVRRGGWNASHERVRTAIARKVPDRVPVQDGPWGANDLMQIYVKSEQLLMLMAEDPDFVKECVRKYGQY